MDSARKKMLRDAYKSKAAVGAVYCLECSGNHRRIIKVTPDLGGIRNRFNFSMSMKGCPDPMLRDEWCKYGCEALSMTVLEELTQKEDQTEDEFEEDLDLLLELWQEKLASDAADGREGQ